VAEQAYKDSYLHKNASLKKKVELLMDEMFPHVGMPRSQTIIEMDFLITQTANSNGVSLDKNN
jgi:hypothetical protein